MAPHVNRMGPCLLGLTRSFATRMGPPVTRLSIPETDYMVAVASGKGGVGKSTTAVNVAVALAQNHNLSVGLMDADVFGPSIPRLMNLSGKPKPAEDGRMTPLENYGVRCISTGFLMQEGAAAVWRGPMVMSALETFMTKVAWGKLDVLIIDMPPGTGDAQLTISQRMPLTGALMVSTPQDIALIDVRRGATMFRNVKVPIIGMVENMSYYQCPSCGHREHVFGEDGGKDTAKQMQMELLAQIPLHISIRETSDAGTPIVASKPDSPSAQAYSKLADRVWQKLQMAKPNPG